MDHSWADFLSEALSFLWTGWDLHEVIFKRREDGTVGWRKFAFRAQDTVDRWEFDDKGVATDFWQVAPPSYKAVKIPLSRCLHLRLTTEKGNPEGEALALDTPIPSPDGWTTMGALNVGDRVFDETGKIRHVIAISETWNNRPTYELTFNDGS